MSIHGLSATKYGTTTLNIATALAEMPDAEAREALYEVIAAMGAKRSPGAALFVNSAWEHRGELKRGMRSAPIGTGGDN